MIVDGQTMTYGTTYSSFTSQNQNQPPYNNYGAQVWPQDNNNFRIEVAGANTSDQSRVKLWGYNGGIAQRWGYDSNTRQIKGINDKCLDAGNVNDSNNRWLRISTCHNGANQKWFLDTIGRIHSEAKTSLCVDSPQGNTQGSDLYMGACHHGNNQKWTGNLSMNTQETFLPIRSAYNNSYRFNIYGGTNTNETPIRMWGLGNNQWNEAFEYNSTSQEIRNKLGKFVDAWDTNNPSNRWIRINDCNGGSNQRFWADTPYRLHSNPNGNLCIDSQSGDNYNSTIYMGNCYDGKNQKWWVQGWLS